MRKADRERLEKKLDEIIQLLRLVLLKDKVGDVPPYDPSPLVPSEPPSLPPYIPGQPFPNTPAKTACPKCGMGFDGITGYVCGNYPCPMGLGGTYCKAE